MALADKIIDLRKKAGWSQEQLAEHLDISRQSVSKWESGASVPELDKIIKISDLFGVTTDYLLKKETEERTDGYIPERDNTASFEKTSDTPNGSPQDAERTVSQQEATTFIDLAKEVSPKIALGVSLCILSPICLLFLSGIAECSSLLSEDVASAFGIIILLLFAGAGVGYLIFFGMKLDKYEYLEKENISILTETRTLVTEKKENFAPLYRKKVVFGVLLCLCSVMPLFIATAFDPKDFVYSFCMCILLGIVAVGVNCFVKYGIIQGSFDKILEEGDYTRSKKAISKNLGAVAGIYWCFIVAAYLGASFITNKWNITWIIFAIAGILFAACMGVMRLHYDHKQS